MKSWTSFMRGLQTYTVVEPFLFLVTFAAFSRLVVSNELMLAKACTVVLNQTREYCRNITDDQHRSQVLRIGNTYNMASSLSITIPALFTGLLVGAWSDIHGRKWPMVLVPTVINTGVYSYTSETSSPSQRASRFSVLEMVNILAMTFGTTVGGLLFNAGGYLPVYGTSLASLVASIAWLIIFMKEPKPNKLQEQPSKFTNSFFSLENIRSSVFSCFCKREPGVRLRLCLLVLSCCCFRFSLIGSSSIAYFYTKEKFSWGVGRFSYISTVFSVAQAVAVAALVQVLTRVFKLSDAILGLLGICSIAGESIAKGLATSEWIYFLGLTLGILGGTATVAVKNHVSQLVTKDELGKLFMLVSISESLGNIGGTAAFSQIYNATLETVPGAPYLVSACIMAFPASVLMWIYCSSLPFVEMTLDPCLNEDVPIEVYRRRGSLSNIHF